MDKNTRLNVTFLENPVEKLPFNLPFVSEDKSFSIIDFSGIEIFSVVNLGESRTVEAMGLLQSFFGKNITTRNWNTIIRIGKKL